ncbi:GspH/FimT family pseudopilin [Pseudomonas sp. GV071]|uniref:GspH/FimT family pseudopilin n=1 Tax=Pseudomonas sp. GV071 TaxID=2135754 RepID=UPI000D3D8181|nr:GspH/FimT family pseudopilin [Pseudomonas sp. GV071]PTQ67684.1 type IV fimbrial biogenesis protein FimU [Pseudomonas sp. GV071]
MRVRKGSRGFTMIEMMVVVVLLAIFSSMAIPSFINFINNAKVQSTSNELASLLQFARATAVTNNTTYTVCRSDTTWSVKKGADCTTTELRTLTPASDVVVATSGSATPMVFAPNGTTSNNPSIILCRGDVPTEGYKIKVRNSGNIRVANRGLDEAGAALTSCTP